MGSISAQKHFWRCHHTISATSPLPTADGYWMYGGGKGLTSSVQMPHIPRLRTHTAYVQIDWFFFAGFLITCKDHLCTLYIHRLFACSGCVDVLWRQQTQPHFTPPQAYVHYPWNLTMSRGVERSGFKTRTASFVKLLVTVYEQLVQVYHLYYF